MSLEKKITVNLLNQLSITENVVDDFLDQEMQEVDNLYGGNYDGLSTKVLSMFTQNGKRLQVSQDEFVAELTDKRGLDKNIALNILDRLEKADLIICTSDNRYELANNTLVQRVDKKVEAENSLLRNMRVVIRDHMSRDELLDRQYLDHIAPFITRLELDDEQERFVERSHAAIRRSRRRRQLLVLLAILLLAGFALVTTYLAYRNQELYKKEQNTNRDLEKSKKEVENRNEELVESRRLLELYNKDLEGKNEENETLLISKDSILDIAIQAQRDALRAQDSIARVNDNLGKTQLELEESLETANYLRSQANAQRDKAEKAQDEAEREKLQSDRFAISLNAAVRSQSVTDPKLQGLIARQAYSLYKEYVQNSSNELDPDANHPYIFTALRKSLQNLAPDIPLSLKAHNGSINDITISPDGKKMYTASSDGTVKEWSIDYWKPMGHPNMQSRNLLGLPENVVYENVNLSKDQKHLLVSGQLDEVLLYNFQDDYRQLSLFLQPPSEPNDKVYASALIDPSDPTQAIVLRRNIFQTTQTLTKSIRQRDFSDPFTKLDTRANTTVEVDGTKIGLAASTSTEGDRFFIGLQVMDRRIRATQVINLKLDAQGKKYGQAVALAAQQKRGNGVVAIGLENGHLIIGKVDLLSESIWKDDNSSLLTFKPHQAAISDIVFSKNGNYMAVASYDGTISIWDLRYFQDATYQPLIINDHRDWVRSLAFANNDRMLVAGTKDGRLYFWNFHSPDYAQMICERLSAQSQFPNYDRIDDKTWNQFFGENFKKDDQICR